MSEDLRSGYLSTQSENEDAQIESLEVSATAEPDKQVEKAQRLIAFALEVEVGLTRKKALSVAAQFESLDEFLTVTSEELTQRKSITGRRLRLLNADQVDRIRQFQTTRILNVTRDSTENLITLIARDFVRKQVRMLDEMTLERLCPNPFLIKCLNLKTPREVIELNVYMFGTRSIVTSMGFCIEKLLLVSSDSATKGTKPWDLVKLSESGPNIPIQIKSGPNDMDADQIRHWAKNIAEKLAEGEEPFIGITYGKREKASVTLGLFRTYLPDWEKRTLIGRELWDFISGDDGYHSKLFPLLGEAAAQILGTDSIEQRIQGAVERITKEFCDRYGDSAEGVESYLNDIF